MTTSEAATLLVGLDHIYILTHERPDGDTLGSASALCVGLRALGKSAFVLTNPEVTPRYMRFVAPYHADLPPDGAVLVAVDIAAADRLPRCHRELAHRVLLSIDHHPTGECFGAEQCIQTGSASTGEIIFELLQLLSVPLTQDIALPLYLAVSTDTGCFSYSNTTSQTHRVAAALLDTGIDYAAVNREIFGTKSFKRIQIEALMVESMEFYMGRTIALCPLTRDMLEKTGASEDDIDNIAALPRKIEGVDIGVVIKEQLGGTCKISLRASRKYEANRICAQMGGGGHARAAGCEIQGPLLQARQAVLEAIKNIYNFEV